jgi:4-hydroxybenzoate polyprenyltransferase
MMLATMVMSYFCLNDYLLATDLLHKKFIYLICATLLTAAGGYIINDYYDVKLDHINKPGKVIVGNAISRRWAMLLHIWFNGVAILLGLLINGKVAFSICLCALTLLLYSVYFKKQFLIGNLVIAGLSAFVLIILHFFDKTIPVFLIFSYASFAFISTLIREIIKDIEDMKGDSKFDCRTIPIVIGVRKTKRLLLYLTVAFIILLFSYVFTASDPMPFEHTYARWAYILYMLLFVIIPLLAIAYLLYMADVKKDFSRLSFLMKLVMLTGMMSMIFLRI